MNLNLDDYVRVYRKQVEPELCDLTVAALQSVDFKQHQFYSQSDNLYFSNEKELSSYYDPVFTSEPIKGSVWLALKNYTQDIGLDWVTGWDGFSNPKFNKYDVGTQMKEHWDKINDIFDGNVRGVPTFTVVGALNDDYAGGELVLFTDKVYELSKGDVIVFPSNFLYPHRVNEVTTGTRYSFACWAW